MSSSIVTSKTEVSVSRLSADPAHAMTKYRSHRYSVAIATVTAATIRPYLVKVQKLIGLPAPSARPSTTTLAEAPTAVALPPKSAPSANAHHSTCDWPVLLAATRSATMGLIVAT